MKVVMLCKRYSTGRDSLRDRYGRLFHLPAGLAQLGWDVQVFSLSYRSVSTPADVAMPSGLRWEDHSLGIRSLLDYRKAILRAGDGQPDVVWSSSDALNAVIGNWLARSLKVPHVIDLYDDYEAFGLTRLPGLRRMLRNACKSASALTVVSGTLMETMRKRLRTSPVQHLIPNGVGVRSLAFGKQDLLSRLGLPRNSRLVGVVGALDPGRGIDDVFDAFEIVSNRRSDVHLVLVGVERGPTLGRTHDRLHRLGPVPHDDALAIIASLEVSVVCNRDGLFARACHPMKLVESAGLGVPVVAAAVGEVARLLAGRPDALYSPGDSGDLAEKIMAQLDSPRPLDPGMARSWSEVSADLSAALKASVLRSKALA